MKDTPDHRARSDVADPGTITNEQVVRRYEGGHISTVEQNDEYLLITNESTMADFLDPVEDADLIANLVHLYRFDTAAERQRYLDTRYPTQKPPRPA